MIAFIKYLKGYVKVKVQGYSPERFLNLCSNHNILLWDLLYQKDGYEFYISLKGFRRLKPILKKTRTKLIILEKRGLPFFLHRYRKRKLFFIGIALCGTVIYSLSLFIWNIEVEGNFSITDELLLKYLKEEEVIHGSLKTKLNCEDIEGKLRSKFNEIIWASAEIEGTRLIVTIQEGTQISGDQNQLAIPTQPSDIIANKSGVIEQVITRNGVPLVSKGSVVKEGDVLISGRVDVLDDSKEIKGYQYYVADADIKARTIHPYEMSLNQIYIEKQYTGNQKKIYSFGIFNKILKFFGDNIEYENYDTVLTEHPLKLGTNFYLPFFLQIGKVSEYENIEKKYTKKEAEMLLEMKLEEFCENLVQKGIQIIENNVIIEVVDETAKASGTIVVIETIGNYQNTPILEIIPEEIKMEETELEGTE